MNLLIKIIIVILLISCHENHSKDLDSLIIGKWTIPNNDDDIIFKRNGDLIYNLKNWRYEVKSDSTVIIYTKYRLNEMGEYYLDKNEKFNNKIIFLSHEYLVWYDTIFLRYTVFKRY